MILYFANFLRKSKMADLRTPYDVRDLKSWPAKVFNIFIPELPLKAILIQVKQHLHAV